MKRTGLAIASIVLAAAGAVALAAGPAAVRKQAEAKMLVTGRIHVDVAGKVSGYSLDEKEKLPPAVVEIIDRRLPGWMFEPVLVAGRPANATADMSIRLVAKKLDQDNYLVTIRSAAFGDESAKSRRAIQEAIQAKLASAEVADKVCTRGLTPPNYPESGARSGVAANVYLLVKAGADGQVQDVIAEQVNLKVVASERRMEQWRRIFADTAIRQARKWCVEPSHDSMGAGFRTVRVPVTFHLSPQTPYGQWEAYVPGPRQANPWEDKPEGKGFSPDTLTPGRTYVAGAGLKLLTDIGADS